MSDHHEGGLAIVVHPHAELTDAGLATLDAVAGLISRSWRVLLATPSGGPLLDRARRIGAETSAARAAGALPLLRRVRPDAVHVRSASMPTWVIAARLLRVPAVVLVEQPARTPRPLVSAAMATRVLVHSEHDRSATITAARWSVAVAPLAPPDVVVPARERLEGAVRLVHPGGVGSDVAVAALGVLVDDGVDARLLIVGPGPDAAVIDRAVLLGLDGRVTFEPVPQDGDIVLVTGRDGHLVGEAALRAVLAGQPVVVSGVGAAAEWVEGCASAIPVPPGDPAAIASAIRRIIANWSAFRRIALAMAPIAADRHSADRYGVAIDTVMRRSIQQSGSGRTAPRSGSTARDRNPLQIGRPGPDDRSGVI